MPRLRRCLAIHDLSGFGRVSLMLVIPTLSAMGIQVVPAPTAVLSTHTGGAFPDYRFQDLTESMEENFAHWTDLQLDFDGIYSGFLGSPRQCALVGSMIDQCKKKDPLVLIDPVMGDRGQFYSSISPTMAREMRQLIRKAQVITPNLTELFLLLDQPYQADLPKEAFRPLLSAVAQEGPQQIVVTSCPGDRPDQISCQIFDHGQFFQITHPYLEAQYQGTGDLYASLLMGLLLNQVPFVEACGCACEQVQKLILSSKESGEPYSDGVLLEAGLRELSELITPFPQMVPGWREKTEKERRSDRLSPHSKNQR